MQSENVSLTEEIGRLKDKVKEQGIRNQEVQHAHYQERQELKESLREAEKASAKLREELGEREEQLAKLRESRQMLEETNKQLNDKYLNLYRARESEHAEFEQARQDLQGRLSQALGKIDQAHAEQQKKVSEIQKLREQISLQSEETIQLRDRCRRQESELAMAKQQLELLEKEKNQYKMYSDTSSAINQQLIQNIQETNRKY